MVVDTFKEFPRSLSRAAAGMFITLEFPSTCCSQNPTNYLHSYFVFSKHSTTFRLQWNNLVYDPSYVRRRWSYFFTCRLSYSNTRRIRLERLGYLLLTFCSFSSLAYFSLSLFKFFLKRYFGDQNKLLNLAGRAVKYGALNGLIIAHVLPVRCNEGFYLIIYELNALQIPDQIHHCTHAQLVLLSHAKALSATNWEATSHKCTCQPDWGWVTTPSPN